VALFLAPRWPRFVTHATVLFCWRPCLLAWVGMATDVAAGTAAATRAKRRDAVVREIDESVVVARLLREEMKALLASAATATVRSTPLPRLDCTGTLYVCKRLWRMSTALLLREGNAGVRFTRSQQRRHPEPTRGTHQSSPRVQKTQPGRCAVANAV
jgi:hypothetical protein